MGQWTKARIGTTAALVVLLIAAPALAAQTKAHDRPHKTGPLALTDQKCARRDQDRGGRRIAAVISCLRFYRMNPSAESNPKRDYGILWLQSNVDAMAGWCATTVTSEITVPPQTNVNASAPARAIHASRTKHATTKVTSDGGGTASRPGSISQGFTMYPNMEQTSFRTTNAGRVFTLKWSGSTAHKLGLVSGVAISWRTSVGPPKSITFRVGRYTFEKKASC